MSAHKQLHISTGKHNHKQSTHAHIPKDLITVIGSGPFADQDALFVFHLKYIKWLKYMCVCSVGTRVGCNNITFVGNGVV